MRKGLLARTEKNRSVSQFVFFEPKITRLRKPYLRMRVVHRNKELGQWQTDQLVVLFPQEIDWLIDLLTEYRDSLNKGGVSTEREPLEEELSKSG